MLTRRTLGGQQLRVHHLGTHGTAAQVDEGGGGGHGFAPGGHRFTVLIPFHRLFSLSK
jgi:hypothetical protein